MSHLKTWVRGSALLVALGFLALLVRSQWPALRGVDWQVRPALLLLSLVLLEVTWLVELSIWRFLLSRLGGALPWRRAAQAWFLANIMRYIPGNIWQFVGLAELAADDGVSRVVGFTSIALHQLLSTLVGLALAAVYLAIAGQAAWLDAIRPALWLVPLGLLLCHPRLLQWALNQMLRMSKQPPVQVRLTAGQVGLAMAGYLTVWLLMGSSFTLLAAAVLPTTPQPWAAWVATWAAAYVIGYLLLVAPGGLGVREGILVLLLSELIAAPLPIIVALAARLWLVAGELLGAGVALIARVRSNRAAARLQAPAKAVRSGAGARPATAERELA